MGDLRFLDAVRRLAANPTRAHAASLPDVELVEALAGDSVDPYRANVAATELTNRLRRKNAALTMAGEGLAVLDREGRILLLNPAGEALLGSPPGGAVGAEFHRAAHGDLGSPELHLRCPLLLAFGSRRSVRVEEDRFRAGGDSTFPASYTVTPIEREGEVDGHVVVFRDVSTARSLVASLEAREERLEAALRLAGVGRWDWDALHDHFTWDDEAYRMLNLRPGPQATRLRSLLARVARSDRRTFLEALRSACEERRPFAVTHGLEGGGPTALVETKGAFVYDEAGRAVRAWGIHREARADPASLRPVVDASAGEQVPVRDVPSGGHRAPGGG